ncbi:MAG: hypothetical protein PHC90_06970 [Syntrophorhabdaceae bacterium]|nr:hypothetical protein [Syntrophorhabdaceae bacterium]
MTKKRLVLSVVILIALFAAGLVLLARTPLLVRSAAMVSGPLFGYDMEAESFSFYPLRADLKGFSVADTRRGNFLFTSSRVSVSSSPGAAFKGNVERVLLKDPKIRIRLGDKKETETDLSFIRKIPPVHLLTMENGEFTLFFKGSPGTVTLKKIDLTVKDFSPEGGGALSFTSAVVIDGPGGSKMKATGRCKGRLDLTGILPDMLGKGAVDIDIDEGSAGDVALQGMKFTLPVLFEKDRIIISRAAALIEALTLAMDGRKAELRKGQLAMNASYTARSGLISSDSLQVTMPGVGTVKGTGRMTLKGAMPFSAVLETRELNFSSLFSMARSFLGQEEAKKWSIEGSGSLKARMEGSLGGKSPSLSGSVTMDVKKGGFSSPDGSKAAQGITGSVILNFSFPRGDDKDASMKISSQMSSGEYLWGKYYKDLKKEPSKLTSKTDVTVSRKTGSRIKGTCDLFNTGRYAYDGFFGTGQWGFHLTAQDVAVKRIVSVFAADYLAQTAPALEGIEADGKLDADISVTSTDNKLATKGSVKLSTGSLKLPGASLGVAAVDMDVPFDLTAAGGTVVPAQGGRLGMITITGFTKGSYSLPELKIPFMAYGSDVAATGIISLPFYGGAVRIRGLAAKDILGPSPRLVFGALVEGIDFPRLLSEATGLTFPGTVKARFPSVAYQNGEVVTQGKTVIDIFGGRIEAVDVYVKDLFASSRKIGGDILFRDIDLGKITDTIKVGKITGIIEGSVKNLVIEYGQPSRFIFDLDTVKKWGVSRKVSVDAIENISILGTGSGGIGAVLKSGLNKFFKEYPYSRIGIRCTLENDNFNIRGKIVEGGKEYLIRRAFLRGIDVVNRDPQNMVSFKDMQERVGRIFHKDEDGAGPTIKVN